MFKEVLVENIEVHAGAPQIARLLTLWHSHTNVGTLPPYAEFNPERLPGFSPNLAVVEALGEGDYRYIYYGAAIAAESGVQMLGSRVSEWKSEVGAFFCSAYSRAVAERRPVYTVHRANHAARVHLWERAVLPTIDADGIIRLVVFNAALEYKEELLKAVLENSPDGIMAMRGVRGEKDEVVDALVLTVNERMAQILGCSVATLLRGTLLETLPEMRQSEGWARCIEAMETRQPQQFELSFHGAGSITWFNVRVVPLGDGATISASEITSLKNSHRALASQHKKLAHSNALLRRQARELRAAEEAASEVRRQAEQAAQDAEMARGRLFAAFDVVPEGLVLLDKDDRYVLWNRSYADMYTESRETLTVGATFGEVLRAGLAKGQYPEAAGREEAWLSERTARHRAGQSSHEQQLPCGRWVRIEERRTPDGGYIGARVDITELKQREEELKRQNARFDAALNNMSEGLCFFDGAQRLIVCNRRYIEMYDLDPTRVHPGTTLREIIDMRFDAGSCPAMPREQYHDWRNSVAIKCEALRTVVGLVNGKTFEIDHRPMPDGGWVATHADVTERRRMETAIECTNHELERQNATLKEREEALQVQNLRFDAALANMPQGLAMFDAKQRLIVCNEQYARLFGLEPEQVAPGTTLLQILEHRVAKGTYSGHSPEEYIAERLTTALRNRPGISIGELADGRIIASNHQPTMDGGWVITIADISKQRRLEARLAHFAHHDMLTDLPNRLLLQERLDGALATAGPGEHVAVLCLDLDRFKEVNDTLGHGVGDALMKAVGGRLRECVRKTDTVSRTGGDEFAIVHVSAASVEETAALAARLIESISAPYDIEGHQVCIGTSVGIALSPSDGTEPDALLRHADLALYRAKNGGRGTYRFFEQEMNARMQERRRLERDLRCAVAHGELELHFQPLVNLANCEISGFEALVRWNHPQRGQISPADFIPIAEETGLIVPIGEWVLRQACAEAATWLNPLKIAVNLSPVQVKSASLVEMVFSALTASGLSAERLELEITESVLLQDSEATINTLRQLHGIGIHIALDDFGTGYSSLSYLRRFPFDKIKIDRCFISDLSASRGQSLVILNAIIELAGKLGIVTTAEGVETKEQAEIVRAEGCTEMQGYYFCPPQTSAEIARLFFRRTSRSVTAA